MARYLGALARPCMHRPSSPLIGRRTLQGVGPTKSRLLTEHPILEACSNGLAAAQTSGFSVSS